MNRAAARLKVLIKDTERLRSELNAAHPFDSIKQERLRCEGRLAALTEALQIVEEET